MSEVFNPYYRWLGIPPKDQPPNHYRLLSLELFESDPNVIESAADRQMGFLRTYQTGPHAEMSQRLLNEVAAAKVCLLRPEKKAAYDAWLRGQLPLRSSATADDVPAPPIDSELVGEIKQAAHQAVAKRIRQRHQRQQAMFLWGTFLAGIAGLAVVLALVLRNRPPGDEATAKGGPVAGSPSGPSSKSAAPGTDKKAIGKGDLGEPRPGKEPGRRPPDGAPAGKGAKGPAAPDGTPRSVYVYPPDDSLTGPPTPPDEKSEEPDMPVPPEAEQENSRARSAEVDGRDVDRAKAPADAIDGSEDTERAVNAALGWLARHQARDGHWSLSGFTQQCKNPACTGGGTVKSDCGATALGLLPFLAAGQSHQAKGPYQQVVRWGLLWLVKNQEPTGNLAASEPQRMYAHGLATVALSEACRLTKDRVLRSRAEGAVRFIEQAQHPSTGGWRYEPGQDGDTSVLGWQVAALESARMAGIQVNPMAREGARKWLQSVARGDRNGLFCYRPDVSPTPAMTAVGLLCSQRLGAKADDPAVGEGVALLEANQPGKAQRDVYYWYYATQAMHRVGGQTWDQWNRQVRSTLVETQIRDGCASGSWDPAKPAEDRWGQAGGRIMVTSLSCLILEVYHRDLRVGPRAKVKPVPAKGKKK